MAKNDKTLDELFHDVLKDIYYAEKKILSSLPKMAKAAQSPKLKAAFEKHERETDGQIDRLEKVFEIIEAPARGKKCEAMEGLIEEGASLLEEDADSDVLDAGIIAAAQKVEQYEIATYGTLCTWACQLGLEDAADLLGETLEEEKQTDLKLTELAESEINIAAESPEA